MSDGAGSRRRGRVPASVVAVAVAVLAGLFTPVAASARPHRHRRDHQPDDVGAPPSSRPTRAEDPTLGVHVQIAGVAPAPALSLSMTAPPSATPGDRFVDSATVAVGQALVVTGSVRVHNPGDADAVVAAWRGSVDVQRHDGQWDDLSGAASVLTPVPSGGTAFPGGGDGVIGVTIAPGRTAEWTFRTVVPVSASDVASLVDRTRTRRLRQVFSFNASSGLGETQLPGAGSSGVLRRLRRASPLPTAAMVANDVVVALQLPDGSTVTFSGATTPALHAVASGAPVTIGAPIVVAAPSAKGASEADTTYLSRLRALDATRLVASATATSAGFPTAQSTIATVEQVPVLTVAATAPANVAPGGTAAINLATTNVGGGPASRIALTNQAGALQGVVSGAPSNLSAGAAAAPSVALAVPASQPVGPLVDTTHSSWTDSNGNAYGPVATDVTLTVASSAPPPPSGGPITFPAGAGLTAYNRHTDGADMSWTEATGPVDGYRLVVLPAGTAMPTVPENAGSVTGQPPATSVTVRVDALDASGNATSGPTTTFTTLDTSPPPIDVHASGPTVWTAPSGQVLGSSPQLFSPGDTSPHTVTGPDGTVYTLTMGTGSLLSPESISITPITSVIGLPAGVAPPRGVILQPDGLQLGAPATLTITPPAGTPTPTEPIYAVTGQGEGAGLQLTGIDPAVDPAHPLAVSIPITHFSEYWADDMSAADEAAVIHAADELTGVRTIFDELMAKARQRALLGEPQDPAFPATVDSLAQQLFDYGVEPLMNAAIVSPALAPEALGLADSMVRQLVLMGGEPPSQVVANILAKIDDLRLRVIEAAARYRRKRCLTRNSLQDASAYAAATTQLLNLGADFVQVLGVDITEARLEALTCSSLHLDANVRVKANYTDLSENENGWFAQVTGQVDALVHAQRQVSSECGFWLPSRLCWEGSATATGAVPTVRSDPRQTGGCQVQDVHWSTPMTIPVTIGSDLNPVNGAWGLQVFLADRREHMSDQFLLTLAGTGFFSTKARCDTPSPVSDQVALVTEENDALHDGPFDVRVLEPHAVAADSPRLAGLTGHAEVDLQVTVPVAPPSA